EDGRDRRVLGSGVILARDLVENRLHFQVVVGLCPQARPIGRGDLRSEKIYDALARWPVHDVVGGVLVGPGGVQPGSSGNLEDGVDAEKAVGVDRRAAFAAVEW